MVKQIVATKGDLLLTTVDHTPILLNSNPSESFAHRSFGFEAAWIKDLGTYEIIKNAWNQEYLSSVFTKLCQNQEASRRAFRRWNKEVCAHYQDKINTLLTKIKDNHSRESSDHNELVETALQVELVKWLAKSEVLWRQKFRDLWLQYGDRNTNFSTSLLLFRGIGTI